MSEVRSIVERIERLEEDKAAVAADIAAVYDEAKSNGYDVKILRKIVAYRKKDENELSTEQALFETYMAELG